jgi:hypothetical protein
MPSPKEYYPIKEISGKAKNERNSRKEIAKILTIYFSTLAYLKVSLVFLQSHQKLKLLATISISVKQNLTQHVHFTH